MARAARNRSSNLSLKTVAQLCTGPLATWAIEWAEWNEGMNRAIQDLYDRASELAPADRAELAGLLLESLEESGFPSEEIEQAWAAEVERRMADFRAGRVETVSWQELRAQLHRADR